MSLLRWCMLILVLCSNTAEMAAVTNRSVRFELRQNNIRNIKRHSDGTFTSDLTHYLDKIKAKDFVEWLASTKREG
uniref:Glucagon / GIP / secretin / VIP family domain-containing protein n=1 Tax=Anabas testudineus TaxID=64144 RepID=A0A3Q1JHT4_ANATE